MSIFKIKLFYSLVFAYKRDVIVIQFVKFIWFILKCVLCLKTMPCEHTLKLTSEATVCWCPRILSTISVFSTFHFECCTFLNPLSAVMSIGSSSADGGRKYLTKNLCLQPPSAGSVNIRDPNRQRIPTSTSCT